MDAANGWASGPQDKTIIDLIMLRYRPIAPKPVADGSSNGSAAPTNTSELVTKPRKKRKYVRVKQTSRRCKVGEKDNNDKQTHIAGADSELRGEVSGSKGSLTASGSSINLDFTAGQVPLLMNMDKSENNGVFITRGLLDQPDPTAVRVVETWVMVDGITDTWLDDKQGLGSTDMEKMKNLELDTCPGLISDGFDRVQWVNLAYRRMVDPVKDGGDEPAEAMVWLVVKQNLPVVLQAFACTVRVVYTHRKVKHSKTMPCDVWKMDFGGFAWRLDAKAALSLGR